MNLSIIVLLILDLNLYIFLGPLMSRLGLILFVNIENSLSRQERSKINNYNLVVVIYNKSFSKQVVQRTGGR